MPHLKISSGSRLLLDTHIFLWAAGAPENLSDVARSAIEDPTNDVYVSAAVVWEIIIKHALGKLELPAPPAAYLPIRITELGFRELPIRHSHAIAVAALPAYHRDPFDRILIAQARIEGMRLLTVDPLVARYQVSYLLASASSRRHRARRRSHTRA
jgi:PIN domain nuclease of toxin-antitoxin system